MNEKENQKLEEKKRKVLEILNLWESREIGRVGNETRTREEKKLNMVEDDALEK
ncbi:hypothetical protein MLOOGBEN_06520 [Bacillus sp. EB106-08-02-XG196]|uniref:hypothetical protein n=1 Tax=Bacillus sp. EB106-08-02-XG196 TaxID=2737049 RepID=UPI0015C479FC|nr:hypothetical protein [Bacillus sp. EB106-08-02-XG196]NWQ40353.1 hypothetical protein [Bacillus sp. EB106-08-02-XG196]